MQRPSSVWSVLNAHNTTNAIVARVKNRPSETSWCITTVYGPQAETEKLAFLEELGQIHQQHTGPWLLCGDFNMIYRAEDKNNNRLHRCQIGHFRRFINTYELKELDLQGRRFIWSNEQHNPTLERLDRVFVWIEWENLHPNNLLRSLSTDCSDHVPLLLCTDALSHFRKRF